MSMTEMEKDLASAMDAGQLDEGPEDDLEADIAAAAADDGDAKKSEDYLGEKDDEKTDENQDVDDAPAADEKKTEEKDDETPDVKADKAPSSWSPSNREHWAKLPPSVQQQVAKREREINDALQHTAGERKIAQSFTQAAQPFQALMAAEGVANPVDAFKGLMNTASALKMGSPQQKAQKIKDLINHYGVDIETLDSVLSGEAPTKSANSEVEQLIADRLKPMESMINSYQQREQDQLTSQNTKTATEVEQFGAKNEFFSDVRLTMADAMDMATKQGRSMTLDEAYKFACNITPDIKSVLDTRASHNNIDKKKLASSSLSHKMGGGGGREQPAGLEAQIADAWDNSGV